MVVKYKINNFKSCLHMITCFFMSLYCLFSYYQFNTWQLTGKGVATVELHFFLLTLLYFRKFQNWYDRNPVIYKSFIFHTWLFVSICQCKCLINLSWFKMYPHMKKGGWINACVKWNFTWLKPKVTGKESFLYSQKC